MKARKVPQHVRLLILGTQKNNFEKNLDQTKGKPRDEPLANQTNMRRRLHQWLNARWSSPQKMRAGESAQPTHRGNALLKQRRCDERSTSCPIPKTQPDQFSAHQFPPKWRQQLSYIGHNVPGSKHKITSPPSKQFAERMCQCAFSDPARTASIRNMKTPARYVGNCSVMLLLDELHVKKRCHANGEVDWTYTFEICQTPKNPHAHAEIANPGLAVTLDAWPLVGRSPTLGPIICWHLWNCSNLLHVTTTIHRWTAITDVCARNNFHVASRLDPNPTNKPCFVVFTPWQRVE